VQPADLAVEAVEPGRKARQVPAAVQCLLGQLQRFLGRLAEALRFAFGAAFLRDLIQLGLGALDLSEGGNILTRIERAFHELAADADEGAQQREIVDLSGEVAGADDGRAAPRQLGEIGRAAQLLHLLVRLEQRPQSHWAGDHVAVDEAKNLLVDAPVQRFEEMIGPEPHLNVFGQPIVDHQRAEQGRLRLDIVRQGGGLVRRRIGETDDVFGHGGTVRPVGIWG
jgi:hypothetical protein